MMKIEIRDLNKRIDAAQRESIERRLFYALGRFGHRIRRVLLRLEDLNGPRGGWDQRCHIELRMTGRSMLVVDVCDSALEPAVNRAADRMARRVRDELSMRRTRRHSRAVARPPTL